MLRFLLLSKVTGAAGIFWIVYIPIHPNVSRDKPVSHDQHDATWKYTQNDSEYIAMCIYFKQKYEVVLKMNKQFSVFVYNACTIISMIWHHMFLSSLFSHEGAFDYLIFGILMPTWAWEDQRWCIKCLKVWIEEYSIFDTFHPWVHIATLIKALRT